MRTQAFNKVTYRRDWDLQIINMLPFEQMTPYAPVFQVLKSSVCVWTWMSVHLRVKTLTSGNPGKKYKLLF